MATHPFELIFACTPAQLEVALITTLPAVGFIVMRMPIQTTGIIVGSAGGTGTSAGLGQLDFSYDGKYFLKFFGANVVPTGVQINPGIPNHQIGATLVTLLTTTLAGTLGAPVPVNQANAPSNAADA